MNLQKEKLNSPDIAIQKPVKVVVAEGDGIGPEIMNATLKILEAAGADIELEFIEVGKAAYLAGHSSGITDESWDVITKNNISSIIPIVNASFEDSLLSNGQFTIENIPGWTYLGGPGNGGAYNPLASDFIGSIPDGNNTAYSNGGGFSQVLSSNLEANKVYTLSVDIGDRTNTNLTPFSVEVLAGGNVLASGTQSDVFVPSGGFGSLSFSFDSSSSAFIGEPLEIRFQASGAQVNFDNFALEVQDAF